MAEGNNGQNIQTLQVLFPDETVKILFSLLVFGRDGPDRHCIHRKFLYPVDLKHPAAELMLKRCDTAASQPNPLSREVEVLSQVPGVDQGDPMGIDTVPPFGAVGDHRPIEDDVCLSGPLLTGQTVSDLFVKIFRQAEKFQRVFHRQIVVDAGPQSVHQPNRQIGLERVTGAAAGDSAQGRIGFAAQFFDSLGCPEQKRQLCKTDRLFGVDPLALAVAEEGIQVVFSF